jgi:hypothetical protein
MPTQAGWASKVSAVNNTASFEIEDVTPAPLVLDSNDLGGSRARLLRCRRRVRDRTARCGRSSGLRTASQSRRSGRPACIRKRICDALYEHGPMDARSITLPEVRPSRKYSQQPALFGVINGRSGAR